MNSRSSSWIKVDFLSTVKSEILQNIHSAVRCQYKLHVEGAKKRTKRLCYVECQSINLSCFLDYVDSSIAAVQCGRQWDFKNNQLDILQNRFLWDIKRRDSTDCLYKICGVVRYQSLCRFLSRVTKSKFQSSSAGRPAHATSSTFKETKWHFKIFDSLQQFW